MAREGSVRNGMSVWKRGERVTRRRVIELVMALALLVWFCIPALAEEETQQKNPDDDIAQITKEDWAKVEKMVKWFDRFTFYGDLRVRHESFFTNFDDSGGMNFGVNFHRERFRLRLGFDVRMGDFAGHMLFASGTNQQVSSDQTETALATEKQFWIEQGYLSWQGSSTRWLKINMGKMINPYFMNYSSDVVWDTDLNPEGYAEQLNFDLGSHVNLFLNAGQFVMNQQPSTNVVVDSLTGEILGISGSSHQPWLIGEQLGVSMTTASQLQDNLAIAFYDFVNVSGADAAPLNGLVQQGNSRTGLGVLPPGTLLNNYRVLDITSQLQTKVGSIPFSIIGDYIRNLANTTDNGINTGHATGNHGYQVGAILGHAADAHTWELAYFYKLVQTDATLADLNDADFGNGGTARRGHIIWFAYNLTKFLQLKVKYFITTSIVPMSTPGAPPPYGNCYNVPNPINPTQYPPQNGSCGDINRLQADILMQF